VIKRARPTYEGTCIKHTVINIKMKLPCPTPDAIKKKGKEKLLENKDAAHAAVVAVVFVLVAHHQIEKCQR